MLSRASRTIALARGLDLHTLSHRAPRPSQAGGGDLGIPHPAPTYAVEAERPGWEAATPGKGEVSAGKGVMLQADRSGRQVSHASGQAYFGVRETSGPILTQEGHTAMQGWPYTTLCVTAIWNLYIYYDSFLLRGRERLLYTCKGASSLLFVICLFLHLLHLPRIAPRQGLISSVPSAQYREDPFQAFTE